MSPTFCCVSVVKSPMLKIALVGSAIGDTPGRSVQRSLFAPSCMAADTPLTNRWKPVRTEPSPNEKFTPPE
jgi:hypothetical protein